MLSSLKGGFCNVKTACPALSLKEPRSTTLHAFASSNNTSSKTKSFNVASSSKFSSLTSELSGADAVPHVCFFKFASDAMTKPWARKNFDVSLESFWCIVPGFSGRKTVPDSVDPVSKMFFPLSEMTHLGCPYQGQQLGSTGHKANHEGVPVLRSCVRDDSGGCRAGESCLG
jgi:hypothetical protein